MGGDQKVKIIFCNFLLKVYSQFGIFTVTRDTNYLNKFVKTLGTNVSSHKTAYRISYRVAK